MWERGGGRAGRRSAERGPLGSGEIMKTIESIAAAAKDRAWHAYRCERHRSLTEIAEVELGICRRSFHRCRSEWGWPPRDEAVAAARREVARQLPGLDPALTASVPLSLLAEANPGGRGGEEGPDAEESHAEHHNAEAFRGEDAPAGGTPVETIDFNDLARRMRRLLF